MPRPAPVTRTVEGRSRPESYPCAHRGRARPEGPGSPGPGAARPATGAGAAVKVLPCAEAPTPARWRRGGRRPGRGRSPGPGPRCAPPARGRRGRSGRTRRAGPRVGSPRPVSPPPRSHPAVAVHHDLHPPARRRVAQGVVEQDQHDLLDAGRVGPTSTGAGRPPARRGRRPARAARGTRGATTTSATARPGPPRSITSGQRAGVEARQLELLLHQPLEPGGLLGHRREELAAVALADPIPLQQLEEPLQRGDRGLELMGDVGHEVAPGPLQPPLLGDVAKRHDDAGVGVVDSRAACSSTSTPPGSAISRPVRAASASAGGRPARRPGSARAGRRAGPRRPPGSPSSGSRRRWPRSPRRREPRRGRPRPATDHRAVAVALGGDLGDQRLEALGHPVEALPERHELLRRDPCAGAPARRGRRPRAWRRCRRGAGCVRPGPGRWRPRPGTRARARRSSPGSPGAGPPQLGGDPGQTPHRHHDRLAGGWPRPATPPPRPGRPRDRPEDRPWASGSDVTRSACCGGAR